MDHGFIDVVEVEARGLELVERQQAGADQADQAEGSLRRLHPDAVDADAVAHDPG